MQKNPEKFNLTPAEIRRIRRMQVSVPNDTIIAGNYGDLKGWEKSILQNGLKVRSGASYERELRRLQQMYPGFIPQA